MQQYQYDPDRDLAGLVSVSKDQDKHGDYGGLAS